MATVTVDLGKGITIGGVQHTQAEIREATLGDVLDGTAEAERLVATPEGSWELVPSRAFTAIHILRRQVVRIGEYNGPFTLEIMRRLSGDDLALLQHAATRLEITALEVARAGEPGGVPGGKSNSS